MSDQRFRDALANLDSGATDSGDVPALREALLSHIARGSPHGTVFKPRDWGWIVGQKMYRDWLGFEHIYKLLTRPGERVHVYELTGKADLENARKAAQKSIKRAVNALVETQPNVGLHLEDCIKTGELCVYAGSWKWLV